MKPQIDPVSTEHLLKCLGHAIDETKYVRQLIYTRDAIKTIKQQTPFSRRLTRLDEEITYLENKIAEVRKEANGNRKIV